MLDGPPAAPVAVVGAVAGVVLVGAVVGWVGVCGCAVVVCTVVVVWPTLSDWLVTVGVPLEPLLDTRTMTTTISAATTATVPAIAQPLPPPRRPSAGPAPAA